MGKDNPLQDGDNDSTLQENKTLKAELEALQKEILLIKSKRNDARQLEDPLKETLLAYPNIKTVYFKDEHYFFLKVEGATAKSREDVLKGK